MLVFRDHIPDFLVVLEQSFYVENSVKFMMSVGCIVDEFTYYFDFIFTVDEFIQIVDSRYADQQFPHPLLL